MPFYVSCVLKGSTCSYCCSHSSGMWIGCRSDQHRPNFPAERDLWSFWGVFPSTDSAKKRNGWQGEVSEGCKNKNDKFLPLGCSSARAPPLPRPLRPLSSAERTQPPRRRRPEDGRTSEGKEKERSAKKNALLREPGWRGGTLGRDWLEKRRVLVLWGGVRDIIVVLVVKIAVVVFGTTGALVVVTV